MPPGDRDVVDLDLIDRNAMACPALPTCGLAVTESERGLPDVNARLRLLLTRLGFDDSDTFVVRMTGAPPDLARPGPPDFPADPPRLRRLRHLCRAHDRCVARSGLPAIPLDWLLTRLCFDDSDTFVMRMTGAPPDLAHPDPPDLAAHPSRLRRLRHMRRAHDRCGARSGSPGSSRPDQPRLPLDTLLLRRCTQADVSAHNPLHPLGRQQQQRCVLMRA